ncbi:plasmid replication protein RepC [Pseudovibrio ascidiaceicola]|uniref:plasmid replication protein RepC n=1 Tax=Pseudovibrio ascidiaceicola TaxID=285279 RepID=UPI003D35E4ED
MQTSGAIASFRKLTPAMMRSQRLAMANDIVATTKAEVALALKKAAPALGIEGTCYHILDILIGLTAADDWKQSRRPLVAISNEKLSEYVGRSKRTVMRHIKRLVEVGVLAYRDSPTGRRYIHRGEFRNGKLGEIERGFGFDFSPARQRVVELKETGNAFAKRLQIEKDAKRTISRLQRALQDMAVLAQKEKMNFDEVTSALQSLEEKTLHVTEKAEILQSIYEIAMSLFEHQEEGTTDNKDNLFQEMIAEGDISVTPYNHTNPQTLEKGNNERSSADAERSNHAHPDPVGIKSASEEVENSKFHARSRNASQADGLNSISINLIATALPQLQDSLGTQFETWQDLVGIRHEIALLIGLSPSALQSAEDRVGHYLACAVLATTAEKALRDPDTISSPGGYFRACIDRAEEGELALHKSLFGLAQVK